MEKRRKHRLSWKTSVTKNWIHSLNTHSPRLLKNLILIYLLVHIALSRICFSQYKKPFQHDNVTLAIVTPFVENQMDRLEGHLSIWAEIPACQRQMSISMKYLFYSDKNNISRGVKEKLERIHDNIGVSRKCFSLGWGVLLAGVPPQINTHECGACYQFFLLFKLLKNKYHYFYLMEPDVTPIRPGWLEKLGDELAITSPGQDFWLKGSNQKCNKYYGDIASRHDWHINGNSIYKVGDPGFEEFLANVQGFYTGGHAGCPAGCSTGRMYENAYDHVLFQYLQQEENFDYSKKILHRFQYTPLIVNLCEDDYNISGIFDIYPDAYLLHSKGPELGQSYHAIRSLFYKIRKKHASGNDMMRLTEMGQKGYTMDQIAVQICKDDYNGGHFCYERCQSAYPGQEICSEFAGFDNWATKFGEKVYLWSVDFHAAPSACNAEMYRLAGAEFHAEIDFGNCIYFNNCAKRLQVLAYDDWRGFGLDPCPAKLRKDFFDYYKNDPEMVRVDAVVCSHPVANCELFMPLNKSLIVYATTRLEFGRYDENVAWRKKYLSSQSPYRWEEWVSNLKRIASRPGNVIAANNKYDIYYIKYFTGLDAMYLPSWCSPKAFWKPSKNIVLLGPSRDNLGSPYRSEEEAWTMPLLRGLVEANEKRGNIFSFLRMHQINHGHYDISLLATYQCIVLIPYQISFMSFFEYYRMNIPLFAPSKSLFLSWEHMYNVSWERVYGHPRPYWSDVPFNSSPNAIGKAATLDWLGLADIYTFPHIQYFTSWDHLLSLLSSVNLDRISQQMSTFNSKQKNDLIKSWRQIFRTIRKYRRKNYQDLDDFRTALREIYGVESISRDYKPECL